MRLKIQSHKEELFQRDDQAALQSFGRALRPTVHSFTGLSVSSPHADYTILRSSLFGFRIPSISCSSYHRHFDLRRLRLCFFLFLNFVVYLPCFLLFLFVLLSWARSLSQRLAPAFLVSNRSAD